MMRKATFIFDVVNKNKTLPYPLEYVKDQISISSKEISGEWAGGNY